MLAMSFFMLSANALGQAFPNRPVNFIMPIQPGSSTETLIRLVAQEAGKVIGQPVVIENRLGAGGKIAMNALRGARKDGYTIGMSYNGLLVNQVSADASFKFLPGQDYLPVFLIHEAYLLMVGNPGAPFRDLQGLIAYARSNPGKLSVSGSSRGSNSHLTWEFLKLMTGIDVVVVNYQGEAPAVIDTLNGGVSAMVGSVTLKTHIDSGKLTGIATTGSQRDRIFTTLPTMHEAGLTGFNVSGWYGIIVPPEMPPELVARWQQVFAAAFRSAEVTNMIREQGVVPLGQGADVFAERIRADLQRVGPMIQKAGIKLE